MLHVVLGFAIIGHVVCVKAPYLLPNTSLRGIINCAILSLIDAYLKYFLFTQDPFERLTDAWKKRPPAVRVRRVLALPKPPVDDPRLAEDWCAICWCEMEADDARLTPCGHVFHGECLLQSVRKTAGCPTCRQLFP